MGYLDSGSSAGGGGGGGATGQTIYDILVDAAGGGDYTSLHEALAASTSGQTIYVKAGTYANEGWDDNTDTRHDVTVIGENSRSTIIQLDAGPLILYGTRYTFKNIGFRINSTNKYIVTAGGDSHRFESCYFEQAANTYCFYGNATIRNVQVIDCVFKTTVNITSASTSMITLGTQCQFVNNFVLSNASTNNWQIDVQGEEGLMVGNYFQVNSTTANAFFVGLECHGWSVTGNYFFDFGTNTKFLDVRQYNNNISDNHFYQGKTAITVSSSSADTMLSGNYFESQGVAAINTSGPTASITGNKFTGATSGIVINSGTTDTFLAGNQMTGVTAGITDNGTGTVNKDAVSGGGAPMSVHTYSHNFDMALADITSRYGTDTASTGTVTRTGSGLALSTGTGTSTTAHASINDGSAVFYMNRHYFDRNPKFFWTGCPQSQATGTGYTAYVCQGTMTLDVPPSTATGTGMVYWGFKIVGNTSTGDTEIYGVCNNGVDGEQTVLLLTGHQLDGNETSWFADMISGTKIDFYVDDIDGLVTGTITTGLPTANLDRPFHAGVYKTNTGAASRALEIGRYGYTFDSHVA